MDDVINRNIGLIVESDKKVHMNLLLIIPGLITIYSLVIMLLIADVWISLYQFFYFSAMRIPKVDKKKFIRFERWDLSKLNVLQKINCVYCEYANGLTAWAKAVANQTEIYSCAIKHRHALKDHEHEKKFYSEKLFS